MCDFSNRAPLSGASGKGGQKWFANLPYVSLTLTLSGQPAPTRNTEILAPSVEAFFLDRKKQDKNLRPMNLHLGWSALYIYTSYTFKCNIYNIFSFFFWSCRCTPAMCGGRPYWRTPELLWGKGTPLNAFPVSVCDEILCFMVRSSSQYDYTYAYFRSKYRQQQH